MTKITFYFRELWNGKSKEIYPLHKGVSARELMRSLKIAEETTDSPQAYAIETAVGLVVYPCDVIHHIEISTDNPEANEAQ